MAASTARSVPAGQGAPIPVGPARNRARVNADTTAEPEGLTRRVVLNVLEAFFRRPWLHLLPLILLLALGAATAFRGTEEYRAVGTITAVDSTVIGDLTQTNSGGFNFQSPASATATNINEMLRTNEFLNRVVAELGVEASESQMGLLRTTIASSVRAFDDGEQLVRVAASTEGPDLSLRLAEATIDAYIKTVTDNAASQADAAVRFFEGQVETAREAYEKARTELNNFLVNNNITAGANVSPSTQVEIDRLESNFGRAESQYESQLSSLDQARERADATRTEIAQRIRITDDPELPAAPQPRLKKAVLTLAVFGVLGLLLTLASVIVAATLDRTIRVPGDITAKFGLDVLAVVPDARAR